MGEVYRTVKFPPHWNNRQGLVWESGMLRNRTQPARNTMQSGGHGKPRLTYNCGNRNEHEGRRRAPEGLW